jgi:adenosylcobinamide-GDP ribazoletransferase
VRPFLAALSFLTVTPISGKWAPSEKDLASGTVFFPIVGLVIGIIAALIFSTLRLFLPLFPAVVLIVIFLIAASGGLHMDGLADTADGFFSARKRDCILEIMRDSRIGTMGVIAVAGAMSLKMALLASIPSPLLWRMILLMPVAGRSALLIQMAFLNYAREETGGVASVLNRKSAWTPALVGIAFLIGTGSLIAGWAGFLAGIACLLISLLFCLYVRKKTGGYTGDTLGALCELAEIVPPLIAVVAGIPISSFLPV